MAMVSRFEVYLLNLDPEVTPSPKNTRPCVVISPDEMNSVLSWAIVAPMSAGEREYPTRIVVDFLSGRRSIVLDQMRTVDVRRLSKKIGEIEPSARTELTTRLVEMFA